MFKRSMGIWRQRRSLPMKLMRHVGDVGGTVMMLPRKRSGRVVRRTLVAPALTVIDECGGGSSR